MKLLLGRTAPGSGDTPPRPIRTEGPRSGRHRAASHAPDAWTSDACGTDRITHTQESHSWVYGVIIIIIITQSVA